MDNNTAATVAEQLDKEISSLKEQVASLRKTLQIETSTILSASSSRTLLPPESKPSNSQDDLINYASKQNAYMQQCLHRTVNPVTAFKVLDPDPNAVDGGHVLGLRFEVMSRGQFLRPYYVMLNRPYPQSQHLRVHRHTIPPAVPLAGLAARHLPAPSPGRDDATRKPAAQDLNKFVRVVRRELTRYHNRLGVSADLRRGLGLHENLRLGRGEKDVVEVGIADIQAKQIQLTWADERTGRLVLDDDGVVENCMVLGPRGKDWATTKRLWSKGDRVEEVAKRLTQQIDE